LEEAIDHGKSDDLVRQAAHDLMAICGRIRQGSPP
jgi:hypothetical protein